MNRNDIVEKWIGSCIKDGNIDMLNDLHVDLIDTAWKNRTHWIDAGLESFRIAASIRARDRSKVDIALAFSLESGTQRRGIDFMTLEEFRARLDWSPPALYLLPMGSTPWVRKGNKSSIDQSTAKIDPAILESDVSLRCAYYLEFRSPGSEEYSRTAVFVG